MLFYGIAYVAIGYALHLPLPREPLYIHELIPPWAKLVIWGGSGLIAIICAFIPHVKASIVGFTLLSLPLAWRIASFVLTSIFFPVDIRPVLSSSVIFGVMLSALLVVASWPEPKEGTVMLRGVR